MKQLIFAFIVLSTIACQKQEVDCDNMHSSCIYKQYSSSDCTPNGSELGWQWDHVDSTITKFSTVGCPDAIETEFRLDQERTYNSPLTPESVKKFMEQYPSTCECE